MSQLISREELSQHNGKNGSKVYIAYKGVVYDATESWSWEDGDHFQEHEAGHDLTEEAEYAPHAEDVITALPVVGKLAD